MPNSKVEIRKYTGAEYEYDYQQIGELNAETIAQYCSSLRQRFASQREVQEAAEQWIARTYFAVKYLLAASLMLSSAEFASARNLRIVEPYLLYYALFNSSRALFLMIPEHSWSDGRLLDDITHTKVQNVIYDYLRHLSPAVAERYRETGRRALATRELFSYDFPAEGLKGSSVASITPELNDVIDLCQFLAETAELHSECLQSAFRTLPDVELPNDSRPLARFFQYEHKLLGIPIIDEEDGYRLWQFARHSSKPLSLHLTARPGLVEDFLGAWTPDEEGGQEVDQFNPDNTDWRIIFEFI